ALTLAQRLSADLFGRVLAIAAIVIATVRMRRGGLVRLGISYGLFAPGLISGTIATVVVLPVMACLGILTQLLWQALHLGQNYVHEMLKMLGSESDQKLRLMVIISAAVLAPISEELVFRGYLQTLL